MPEVTCVRASALRANGDKVMLIISGPSAAYIFEVENPDELADSLTHALIGRDDYRAHVRHLAELEQWIEERATGL